MACTVVLMLTTAVLGGCNSGQAPSGPNPFTGPNSFTGPGTIPGGGTTPGGDSTSSDQSVMAGVEQIAAGCVAFYQATGIKPSAMTVMTSVGPYMESWPQNPYTGEPMTNTASGVGNFEVYTFPGNAGPSGSKVDGVRGLLSTGEWYDVEVAY